MSQETENQELTEVEDVTTVEEQESVETAGEEPSKEEAAPLELDAEEQQAIAQMRIRKQKQLDCEAEIVAVLNKFGANLYVDPNSPIGNPSIAVQIV